MMVNSVAMAPWRTAVFCMPFDWLFILEFKESVPCLITATSKGFEDATCEWPQIGMEDNNPTTNIRNNPFIIFLLFLS
jgi:hypothetical protein